MRILTISLFLGTILSLSSCGGGGSSNHNEDIDFSGTYSFELHKTGEEGGGVCSIIGNSFSDVFSVIQNGKKITLTWKDDVYKGQKNNNGFIASYSNDLTSYTMEASNFHNGSGELRYTVKYNFTNSSCSVTMDGTVTKQGVNPQPENKIPDFSGKWSGKLALRGDGCGQPSSRSFVFSVVQSGTSVKVDDGEFKTSGSLYPEQDGFYSQASGERPDGIYQLWKVSHRLKRQSDGTYNFQLSHTIKGADGDGNYECNYKYLGSVTKQ